jgi:adenylate cyclase
MGLEIERKFLVKDAAWKTGALGILYRQGYLLAEKDRTFRVRVVDQVGFLTIKGQTSGISRLEYEYPIPVQDANEMLDRLCLQPLIEKYRYRVEHAGLVWEVDEFLNENGGLILAEVELEEAGQQIALPPWIGAEVSDDPRYYNANLVRHPFTKW